MRSATGIRKQLPLKLPRWLPLIAGLAAFLFLCSAIAQAHLTGVFRYFLKDMEDPTYTTRFLQQQQEEVDRRIQELEPVVEAARLNYEQAAEPVARRLLFYDAYAGSALGSLLSGSQDLVEAAANLAMMQQILQEDVQSIHRVADEYRRLALQQQSLRNHQDLLEEIETLASAREERLQKAPPELEDREYAQQFVLYQMAEDWEWMREHAFLDYFGWANRQLADVSGLLDETPDRSGWILREERLNQTVGGNHGRMRNLRYFLRADHIYLSGWMEGQEDVYRFLTVGVIERGGAKSVQYRVEAMYLDGFPVDPSDPDVEADIYENALLRLDLGALLPEDAQLGFEQNNGYLSLPVR